MAQCFEYLFWKNAKVQSKDLATLLQQQQQPTPIDFQEDTRDSVSGRLALQQKMAHCSKSSL
jgi:hypothetical protein